MTPCALRGLWGATCLEGTELRFQFSDTRFCGLAQGSFLTGALLSLQAGLFGLDAILLGLSTGLFGLDAILLGLQTAMFSL
jgi:hypothetical protein